MDISGLVSMLMYNNSASLVLYVIQATMSQAL